MSAMQDLQRSTRGLSDRLSLLQAFLDLAECRSLTGAAQRLGLSQSTLSRMLQRLETIVGVSLVRRAARGIVLTAEGERLALAAPAVLDSWAAALECGREAKAELAGTIRVVAPVAAGQGLLAVLLARFLSQHPRLSLEIDLRDDPLNLHQSRYDLWIRAGATPDSLVVQELLRVVRLVVASPGTINADHPERLTHYRALRLRNFVPRVLTLTKTSGEQFRLQQKTAMVCEHLETVRVFALAGLGYAVLPLWAVKTDMEKGTLVRLCQAWEPPVVKLSLAFIPHAKRPARINELIRFLRQELTKPEGDDLAYLPKQ